MVTRAKTSVFRQHNYSYISRQASGLLYALLYFSILHGFTSAAKNPDWLAAIDEEIKALHDN
jgi:hypothetical protein